MLLHDSYIQSMNKPFNTTHNTTITVAYSPLFHSKLTLIISIFGFIFNLICSIKLWLVICQYRQRKLNKIVQTEDSIHILSHNKYKFLLILTCNNVLLCLSSIISCLDETYFFQSFLARHHLCAVQILIWKITLHFIPLLIIFILCRYHYILKTKFQYKSSRFETLRQFLCTDLSILIPFVLALAWSVDSLWLWGVANIKDYITPATTNQDKNITNTNDSLIKSEKISFDNRYIPEQTTICYLQTNHNFHFTVRLVYLIHANFMLLLSLHLFGLILEITLHMRLCCCVVIKKGSSTFNQERQLCIYILYIFILITLTSLPFYLCRTSEVIFDIQLTLLNIEFINSRIFAQMLLCGISFNPLLFLILFFPKSYLFKLKCYLKCYSPGNIKILDQKEPILSPINQPNHEQHQKNPQPIHHTKRHCSSLLTRSSYQPTISSKPRTQSQPIIITNHRQLSLSNSEHIENWLQLTNSIIKKTNSPGRSNIDFV